MGLFSCFTKIAPQKIALLRLCLSFEGFKISVASRWVGLGEDSHYSIVLVRLPGQQCCPFSYLEAVCARHKIDCLISTNNWQLSDVY